MGNRLLSVVKTLRERLQVRTKTYRQNWQRSLCVVRTSLRSVSKKIHWSRVLTRKGVYTLSALVMVIVTIIGIIYFVAGKDAPADQGAGNELLMLRELAGYSAPPVAENDGLEASGSEQAAGSILVSSDFVAPMATDTGEEVADAVAGMKAAAEAVEVAQDPVTAKFIEADFTLVEDMIAPVVAPVSSPFGWRQHPVLGDWRFHAGVDFAVPLDSSIQAALSGEVISVENDPLLGAVVTILHEQGWETRYGNCGEIQVELGQYVLQGEELAKVGETSLVKEPHLHFELRREGNALDPAEYLPSLINGVETE
ncbi:MAG: peptidoglycan DD-metalloendopeptidase family protein [bacterium]